MTALCNPGRTATDHNRLAKWPCNSRPRLPVDLVWDRRLQRPSTGMMVVPSWLFHLGQLLMKTGVAIGPNLTNSPRSKWQAAARSDC